MSHSRKKHPFGGYGSAESDKPGKVFAHRRYRHYANNLTTADDWDFINSRKILENPYDYPKDGKGYWPAGKHDWKYLRK